MPSVRLQCSVDRLWISFWRGEWEAAGIEPAEPSLDPRLASALHRSFAPCRCTDPENDEEHAKRAPPIYPLTVSRTSRPSGGGLDVTLVTGRPRLAVY